MGSAAVALLERSEELGRLRARINAATVGNGAVVLIEGPAGIGKTSMLAAAVETAASNGLDVHRASAGRLERDLSWNIVRQLFADVITADESTRRELLDGAAGLARPALGLSTTAAPLGDEAGALHGLYWLTSALAARSPLVLAVDDTHWGDSPSLRYLAYVGARVGDLPLLLLLTTRLGEEQPEALLELGLHAGAEQIALHALSERASATLTRGTLGTRAAAEFCSACHAVTRGNPFLLKELLGQLERDHIDPTVDRAAEVVRVSPQTVRRAVLMRLAALAPGAHELARAVAVLGDEVKPAEAAALAGLDPRAAARAADALSAAEVLTAQRPLRFVHPLVREAIYAEIPPHERAERHAQAARLLGQLGADHARIAVQLLRSEPAADGWAVARLRDAAATALSQGARDPAVEFLRRALIEPPEESQRVPVLRELARAEGLAGSTTAIEHLREALTLAQDARVQADIGLELVFMLFVHGRMQDAVELSHTVLERLPPGDRTLELSVIAAAVTGAVLVPELRPRIDSFLARIPNDLRGETREERLATSARLAARLCRRASTDEVAELAERALGGGRLLEDLASYELLYWNAASALVVAERFDAARDAIQAGLADARRRGSSLGFALSSCFRSLLHYRTGDVAAGAADGRQALAVVQPSELMVRAYIVAFLIDCLIERDELDEALALASAPEFAAGLPPLLGFDFLRVARGRVYVLRGDARRGLDELLGVGTTSGAFGPAVCPWRARAAVALCALDERREAQRLAEGELADACATRCAWGEALALQALAMAAPDQATELLERAIAAAESRGLALERARAIVMLGAHLRRQGKRHEAAVLLREGIDAADACGALALGERAREEAVAIGLTPRSRRETGVDELTPAERRVAEMAASGMSNREIAQGLFVSLRTVETHLTHSYQKLGIESRSGLERALAAT